MNTPRLSIIVPVYNEADGIISFLEYCKNALAYPELTEILLINGFSTDATAKRIQKYIEDSTHKTTFYLYTSKKGRSKQMNLGAELAKAPVLYFLHADSFPPKHFDIHINSAIENRNLAGCFRMQFNNKHWWLQLSGWFTQFNWMICRGGDQSLFITSTLFKKLGGYNESYRIYEDNLLIKELYKTHNFTVLPQRITTSARLYTSKGIATVQYHFWMIYLLKRFGANADTLFQYYKTHLS